MILGLPLSIQTPDHPLSYFWYSCNVESLRSPCCPPYGYCTPECLLIQRNGRLTVFDLFINFGIVLANETVCSKGHVLDVPQKNPSKLLLPVVLRRLTIY